MRYRISLSCHERPFVLISSLTGSAWLLSSRPIDLVLILLSHSANTSRFVGQICLLVESSPNKTDRPTTNLVVNVFL